MTSPRKAIMVVDDELDVVSSAKLALKAHGYHADGFTEPEKALEEFRKNYEKYSLILCDIRMPGMGGFEFARNVRMINADIPFVFMTAFEINKSEFSKIFPSTQVAELVTKPISNVQLASIAKKYAGRILQH